MPDTPIDDTPLARRLLVALVTPVVLLIAAGAVLGAQVAHMADDARWVEHSNEVIGKTFELQKLIIDQETGVRGFLVNGNRTFLEPYLKAKPLEAVKELRALVDDSPAQQDRVDEVRRRYEGWLEETRPGIEGTAFDDARSDEFMLERKARMDNLRAGVDDLLTVEFGLRRQRTAASESSVQSTRWAFVGILLALSAVLAFLSRRQMTGIVATFTGALTREREARARLQAEDWVRSGHVQIAEAIVGDRTPSAVAEQALRTIASYVHADVGAFYGLDGGGWRRLAGFALDPSSAGPPQFKAGEGLVGQAGAEQRIRRIRAVPGDYLKVRSGTGERAPVDLVIVPAQSDGLTQAVFELGFLREIDAPAMQLVERVGETVAIALRSADYRARLQELLEESQKQAEELQTQQEELRVTNEELQSQSDALREAHAQLEERKEELEVSNASLLAQRNDLERATRLIEEKAAEVDRASRYKSEFLANMSHELRTPLNSSLILAKLLASNKDGNLSAEQVKFASMIYDAGNDLLVLINDILDLSKVEAGKLEVHARAVGPGRIVEDVARAIEPLARDKKLAFRARVDESAPPEMETDVQRVHQILKNLLSNAIKFTEFGEVSLTVRAAGDRIAFVVADTGIGISKEQHEVIFEAFHQADSGANRRFAGTGLGLSISRSLSRLLRGELTVESEEGRGSTFTLTVPRVFDAAAEPLPAPPPAAKPAPTRRPTATSPRLVPPSPSPTTATASTRTGASCWSWKTTPRSRRSCSTSPTSSGSSASSPTRPTRECSSRSNGCRARSCSTCSSPITRACRCSTGSSATRRRATFPCTFARCPTTRKRRSRWARPGMSSSPCSRRSCSPRSASSKTSSRVASAGSSWSRTTTDSARASCSSSGGGDVEIVGGEHRGRRARRSSASTTFDCVVTDLALPDASGDDLLQRMAEDDTYSFPPVIVYTGRSLTAAEEQRLRKHSSSIIVKGARSPERLLDEVTLFLHQVESELPADQRRMLAQARDREAIFAGRRILVVEDDARNIFALSSVLEPKGAKVLIARNGREALEVLDEREDVDLVLMDIMMPEMDGVTATREIRKRGAWPKLPIIALTAKAMKDDQERCLQAGANDYISKPLDVEMLLSLLRVWMPKS